MGHKPRKISRVVPPKVKDEPASEPPYLNPTANWYSGDAWFLFVEIAQRCGLPTAKFIFQKCVEVADEQENQAKAIQKAKAVRRDRAPIKLPTMEQIRAADRQQVSIWWARLRGTDQKFGNRDKPIIAALAERYKALDGYTRDFNENLPPIKKRGSKMRNSPNAELPRLFEEAKAVHGEDFSKAAFSVMHANRIGESPENVRKNLDYHLKRKT